MPSLWPLLLLAPAVNQNPILVLMQPARVSGIQSQAFHNGSFIRWNHGLPGRNNRLWSVMTGLGWTGVPGGSRFSEVNRNYVYSYHSVLKERGYFKALTYTGAVSVLADMHGASTNSLFLGLRESSQVVSITPLDTPWPKTALMIAEARSWDAVAQIRSRTSGPVAVVEYPPPDDRNWSRLWVFNSPQKGNPTSREALSRVINVGDIPKMLTDPVSLLWLSTSEPSPLPSFLLAAEYAPWIVGVWGALWAVALGMGAIFVMSERPSRLLTFGIECLMLSVPALCLSGGLPLASFALAPLLVGLSRLLRFILHRRVPLAHELWPHAIIGLLVTACVDSKFSILGRIFTDNRGSPEVLAALACYGVWAVLGAPRINRLQSVLSYACIGLVLGSVWLFHPWHSSEQGAAAVVVFAAWLIADGFWTWFIVLGAGLISAVYGCLSGYAYLPYDLIERFDQVEKINAEGYVRFLLSPGFLALASLAGIITLFGDRFFVYRSRQITKLDSRHLALFRLAACCAAVGMFLPQALPLAMFVLLAALSTLIWQAVS